MEAIHAGLECCGILTGKAAGKRLLYPSTDMKDIHTPEERLSISSTKRYEVMFLKYTRKRKEIKEQSIMILFQCDYNEKCVPGLWKE